MNIVLIGYGKMGKEIECVALERGHKISAIFDIDKDISKTQNLKFLGDVAIEFTTPNSALTNVSTCVNAALPIVSGTTGWTFDAVEMNKNCINNSTSMFYSSNYSIGMNIFMAVSEMLAKRLSAYPQYSAKIQETHHVHKLDKPSGTAITLAKGIIANNKKYDLWKLDEQANNIVEINSFREGEFFGDHEIIWDSDFDRINIKHSAKSRKALAIGAVLAAEFVFGKCGFFTMKDLFQI